MTGKKNLNLLHYNIRACLYGPQGESDTHAWAYRPRAPVAVVVPVYDDRRSPVFSRAEQLRRMINVNGASVGGGRKLACWAGSVRSSAGEVGDFFDEKINKNETVRERERERETERKRNKSTYERTKSLRLDRGVRQIAAGCTSYTE